MRNLVVSLVLVACRPQAGAAPVAREGPQPAATPVTSAPLPPPAAVASDRDADGVPDASDGCPDEPEDRDGWQDEDGCVDRDNDQDGIPDAHEFKDGRWTNCDRMVQNGVEIDCRNRPEDQDGVEDHDGCPDILCLSQCSRRLSTRVRLDRRGEFIGDSARALDEVAAALTEWPEFQIWVEAHVDEQRDDAAAKRVTQRAAARVVDELVRRGIDRERLDPLGWGDQKPIDRNTSASGRANNRRVEFQVKLDECCRPLARDPPPPEPRGPECR